MEYQELRITIGFIVLLIVSYGASITYYILSLLKRKPSILKKLDVTLEGTNKFLYGLSIGIIAIGLFCTIFCFILSYDLQFADPVRNERIIAFAIIGILNIPQVGIGIKLFINNRSILKSKCPGTK